jgi:hypothetical protein
MGPKFGKHKVWQSGLKRQHEMRCSVNESRCDTEWLGFEYLHQAPEGDGEEMNRTGSLSLA